MAIKTSIQLRRDTLSAWTANGNTVLKAGEVALVAVNNDLSNPVWRMKIGDGTHNFTTLLYVDTNLSVDGTLL